MRQAVAPVRDPVVEVVERVVRPVYRLGVVNSSFIFKRFPGEGYKPIWSGKDENEAQTKLEELVCKKGTNVVVVRQKSRIPLSRHEAAGRPAEHVIIRMAGAPRGANDPVSAVEYLQIPAENEDEILL